MKYDHEWKFKAAGFYITVKACFKHGRIFLNWNAFNGPGKRLKDILKSMGAKWHGFEDKPIKAWSLENNSRNVFRLCHLRKDMPDPFVHYDAELPEYEAVRVYRNRDGEICPAYEHQKEMWSHIIGPRHVLIAGEMGVGKTRAVLEAMEWALQNGLVEESDCLFVGPRSALESVRDDVYEWGFSFQPHLMTYNKFVKMVEDWEDGQPAPKFLVFDESSKLKNPPTKRSLAAKYVADAIRAEHGRDSFIVLMSGSPAPKSPADWYWQCEIACPGFLLEGTHKKFMDRLAIVSRVENDLTGGSYPKLLGWRDNKQRCTHCAELKDHVNHDPECAMFGGDDFHKFEACKNEVEKLYSRMKGLVIVKLKKDCLDLPDRVAIVRRVKPSQRTLNAAKLIMRRAKSVAQGLVLLRELSDGFQYKDDPKDEVVCDLCGGSGEQLVKYDPADPWAPLTQEALMSGKELESRLMACDKCGGQGRYTTYERRAHQVPCPKDDVLREELEMHTDIGRLACFAGFTGSLDRVTKVALSMDWHVVRVDGRGWTGFAPAGAEPLHGTRQELYQVFRRNRKEYPKTFFCGQAGAAGMGLNLCASPTLLFYSNDFNFESRVQALERNARPGIEKTLALMPEEYRKIRTVDIVHLEVDQMVLDNLTKKKRLQALTLGDLETALKIDEERQH